MENAAAWITPQQLLSALAAGHGDEYCDPVLGSARTACYKRLASGQLAWLASAMFQDDEPCAHVPAQAWRRVLKADWFCGDFDLRQDGVVDRGAIARGRVSQIRYALFGVRFSKGDAEAMGARFEEAPGVAHKELPLRVGSQGKLPANATSSDRRDERYAHEVARKVCLGAKISEAIRSVAPSDPTRDADSIERGIRRTYDKMYDARGKAISL